MRTGSWIHPPPVHWRICDEIFFTITQIDPEWAQKQPIYHIYQKILSYYLFRSQMRPIRTYYNEEKEQHSIDFEETSKNFLKCLNFKKKKTKLLNTLLFLVEYRKIWSIWNTTGKSYRISRVRWKDIRMKFKGSWKRWKKRGEHGT